MPARDVGGNVRGVGEEPGAGSTAIPGRIKSALKGLGGARGAGDKEEEYRCCSRRGKGGPWMKMFRGGGKEKKPAARSIPDRAGKAARFGTGDRGEVALGNYKK